MLRSVLANSRAAPPEVRTSCGAEVLAIDEGSLGKDSLASQFRAGVFIHCVQWLVKQPRREEISQTFLQAVKSMHLPEPLSL